MATVPWPEVVTVRVCVVGGGAATVIEGAGE